MLEVIEQEGLIANAAKVGGYLKDGLGELAHRHAAIAEVRGAGLYLGVELLQPDTGAPAPALAAGVINALRERRVLIGAAGLHGNVLKLQAAAAVHGGERGPADRRSRRCAHRVRQVTPAPACRSRLRA